MPIVKARDQRVFVDDKSIPLISGEVHYWRLNPTHWKKILDRVKELDLKIVSTYIPWNYHEYERDKFDFTGRTDPPRDLLRFLELTRKEGFWLVVRPGPYIYSEWPYQGVPEYAYRYHRLHPQFLAWAKDYMRIVSEVIRPYLASKPGGHIILLQADNEIDCWPDVFGAQYGLSKKPGLFQEFMKAKYNSNIRALNQRWGSSYRHFKEVGPFTARMVDLDLDSPRGYPLKGDPELRRNMDFFEFKHFYAERYAREIVNEYRRLEIDVPIYLNTYPFFYAHDWRSLQKACDFVGLDIYVHNEFREDEAVHRKTIDKFRYIREASRMAFVAEFGCGVWHPQHYVSGVLTPNHYRLVTASALLGGVTGWNWYMLVNRDDWYMSPINEWGRVRQELFSVFKDLVKWYRLMNPPECHKLSDVGVTYNTLQYAAKTVRQKGSVLEALYEADVDYRLFDPAHDEMNTRILFYSGNQWLSRKTQERLRDYVKKGGILVAFQDWPRKDQEFQPLSLVGFEEPDRNLFEFKKPFKIRLGRDVLDLSAAVFEFGRVRGKKITAKFDCGYDELCVGYLKNVGRGKILHLGFEPTAELIRSILRLFHVSLYSYSITPGVQTGMFCRGRQMFLVLAHNSSEDKAATIKLPCLTGRRKKYRIRNLISGKIEQQVSGNNPELNLSVRAKDGYVFEIE